MWTFLLVCWHLAFWQSVFCRSTFWYSALKRCSYFLAIELQVLCVENQGCQIFLVQYMHPNGKMI
jgi:hypothetical protein